MGLEIATTQAGDAVVIALTGELDVYTVRDFSAATERLNASRPVVVDLRRVDLVDSSGLAALARLSHRVRPTLRCPGSLVRLLEMTGLIGQFEIAQSLSEPVDAESLPPTARF